MRMPGRRLLLAFLIGWLAGTAFAAGRDDPKKEKQAVRPYALIFGNVFDPAGRLFTGAEVEIRREGERKARWETRSDSRGEFAVRLPAGPARYIITLRAKGFAEEVRTVAVENEERIDLSFRLQPAGAGGER